MLDRENKKDVLKTQKISSQDRQKIMNFLDQINPIIFVMVVCDFLSIKDFFMLLLVSRALKDLTEDVAVWYPRIEADFQQRLFDENNEDLLKWPAIYHHYRVHSKLPSFVKNGYSFFGDKSISYKRLRGNFSFDDLEKAAAVGNMVLVKSLVDQGLIPDKTTLYIAGSSGNLDLVKWLVFHRQLVVDKEMLDIAARFGKQAIVEWVVSDQKIIPDEKTLKAAADAGSLDLVLWLDSRCVYASNAEAETPSYLITRL